MTSRLSPYATVRLEDILITFMKIVARFFTHAIPWKLTVVMRWMNAAGSRNVCMYAFLSMLLLLLLIYYHIYKNKVKKEGKYEERLAVNLRILPPLEMEWKCADCSCGDWS